MNKDKEGFISILLLSIALIVIVITLFMVILV